MTLMRWLEIKMIGPEVPLPGTPGGDPDIRLWGDHPSKDFSELPPCKTAAINPRQRLFSSNPAPRGLQVL